MNVKEIFIEKLKRAGYVPTITQIDLSDEGFETYLKILEEDRENVFHAIYGDNLIENRGTKPTKEWLYRFGEALQDVKVNYIKMTMHYLIMQIKIKAIKL